MSAVDMRDYGGHERRGDGMRPRSRWRVWRLCVVAAATVLALLVWMKARQMRPGREPARDQMQTRLEMEADLLRDLLGEGRAGMARGKEDEGDGGRREHETH